MSSVKMIGMKFKSWIWISRGDNQKSRWQWQRENLSTGRDESKKLLLKQRTPQGGGESGNLDLKKKSTGDKCKRRDELSEDDSDYIQILDIDRQELQVKMAMAKREFEYWEGQIQETIAKKGTSQGGMTVTIWI